jgi:hypothetical protein
MWDKELIITFSDGSRWAIPAEIIAKQRAAWYALHDIGGTITPENEAEYERIEQEEIEHALRDDYEITDWASNNMNWSDVEKHAARISEPKPADYASEYSNAEKDVQERPK